MKRIISLLTALCIILAPTFPVSAGTAEGLSLEKAILTVKQVITIPTSYSDFSDYSYTSGTGDNTGTDWNLNWMDPDNQNSISATVDWKGNIINYNRYEQNSDMTVLAKVTRAQAKTTAYNLIKNVYPGIAPQMKEVNTESALNDTYAHSFQFRLYENNIPVPFVTVSVSVNKYNGQVSSFSGMPDGFVLTSFPTAIPAIDKSAATAAYLDSLGFELSYHSTFDYNKKTLKIFAAYQTSDSGKYIDAMTGKVVTQYNNGPYPMIDKMSQESANLGMGGDSSALTEAEIAEILKIKSLLSQQEAIEKIKAQAPAGAVTTYKVNSATLNEQYNDPGVYLWNISFEDAYASVNAATGELMNFSEYNSTYTGNRNVSEEKCRVIAENYLQKIVAEKYSTCEYSENNTDYTIYAASDLPDYYTFTYDRMVNGIRFDANSLSVTVNRKSGLIESYYCNWNQNAVFPTIEGAITESKLMEIIDATASYGLMYQQTGDKGDVKLVYGFTKLLDSSLYDPKTGNPLNWDGTAYIQTTRPEYTDIKGHFSENAVLMLLQNGYYIAGNQFHPDQKITQLSFFRYLYCNQYNGTSDEDFYKALESMNILKKAEAAPASILIRQDAAKFLIRYLGLERAATHPAIFKAVFKDKISTSYQGYAALANGLGIMKGDLKGKFNGTGQMTNGQTAVAIYQLLQVK